MTNFSKNLLWLVIAVIVIGGFFIWQNKKPKEVAAIRIGISTGPSLALVNVAADKNFFKEEGLNVEIKKFTGGKFALQALVGGSLELATAAELPITLATMNGEKLSMLAQINETKELSMILRKEEGVFSLEKYFAKKRKIATSVGASSEFFTTQFFKKYNISPSQYEIISTKPEDTPIVLSNGSVDGIAIYEPFALFAVQRAGADKVQVLKEPDIYSELMTLVAKSDWAVQHEKDTIKFLRALQKAENFVREHPEESMDVVSSFTTLDKDTIRSVWPFFTLHLSFSKKLIPTMEQEAQWAKDTGKVPREIATPNFREFIFDGPLKKVAPSAVEL